MIDIVTVVFGEELPILSCQAQSLDLYCQNLDTHNIFVMLNEPDLAKKIDLDWWGSMAHKVRLVPRETFAVEWWVDGWVNQQLLKMLGSTLSQNVWSMVLDAKTIISNPLSTQQLLTDRNQIKIGWMPTISVFQPAQDIANRLWNSDNALTLIPGGVPFFFHNECMRSMIQDIESRKQQDFKSWFLAQGKLTEFVLYSTWISTDQERKNLYANDNYLFTTQNICHSDAGQLDQMIQRIDDHAVSISIHRRAWSALSPSQKTLFRQKLLARGISRAETLI